MLGSYNLSMRQPASRIRALILTVALASLGACSDSTEPASLAGQYTATKFTSTLDDTTIDILGGGASISITLTNAGTTTGRLFVPASLTGGTDFEASMDGTYTVSNGAITFQQNADTFFRDLTFTQTGNTLVGSGVFGGATDSVVLTKTAP